MQHPPVGPEGPARLEAQEQQEELEGPGPLELPGHPPAQDRTPPSKGHSFRERG